MLVCRERQQSFDKVAMHWVCFQHSLPFSMTSRDLMFCLHCKEQELLPVLGYQKPMSRFEITDWLQVGHIYPAMFLVWPAEFGNIGVKIERFHTNIMLYNIRVSPGGDGGKGTEYLRPLYPHSSEQQSAGAEQLLLSVTAQTLQFATLLITPHCLHQASFTHFSGPYKHSSLQTLSRPFLSSIKAYFVLS